MARRYKRDSSGRFAGGGGGGSSSKPSAKAKTKSTRTSRATKFVSKVKRAAKSDFTKKVAVGVGTGLALAAADKATRMATGEKGPSMAQRKAAANIARLAKNNAGGGKKMSTATKTFSKNVYNIRSGL